MAPLTEKSKEEVALRGGPNPHLQWPSPLICNSPPWKDPEKKPSLMFQAGFPLCLQQNAGTTQLGESEHRGHTGSSLYPVTKREPEAYPAHTACAQSSLSQRSPPGLAPCDWGFQGVMSLHWRHTVRSFGVFPLKEPLWQVPFVKGTGKMFFPSSP